MDARIDYLQELERRDSAVAARLERLVELGRRADELRARATTVEAELAKLPERRERVTIAAAEAELELVAAREALTKAQREAAGATGDGAERARRRVAEAEADFRAAEERHARLVARLGELDGEEARLGREAEELTRLADELAAALQREPRVGSLPSPPERADPSALQDWAARTHAAVLVARSGLETERDRIVREANELASAVLGEPIPATGVAVLRERLESTRR